MEKMYTLREAREFLRVSNKTIQRWDKQGKIRCIRTPGNRRLVPESEIKRILGNFNQVGQQKPQIIAEDHRNNAGTQEINTKIVEIKQNNQDIEPEKEEMRQEKPISIEEKVEKPKKPQIRKSKKVIRPIEVPRFDVLDALEPPSLTLRSVYGDLLSAATLSRKFTCHDLAARARCPETIAKQFCEKMHSLDYLLESDGSYEIQIEVLR